MSYYRGDYVQGGYYRGDPFIGGLILRGAAAIGRKVLPHITGKALKRVATAATAAAVAVPVLRSVPGRAAGGEMPIQMGPLGIDPGAMLPGGRPGVTWGTKKYRRMNPLNPRALKRAIRRAEGFEKFARKTVNALRSGPKKFKSTSRKRS